MNERRTSLGPAAYRPLEEGETWKPFVPSAQSPAEMTFKAVLAGVVFGILFGAANAYLGLRVGLTISTSIPVAVMTVAAFRALRQLGIGGSLLEANTSQTIGSASSSVASGVIFTLPALFLWGLPPSLAQMTLLAMCGGLLGILFMIPLRRYLIEKEHGKLPYPEGTACAQVLVASEVGGGKAFNVFLGLATGAISKLIFDLAQMFPEKLKVKVPFLKKGEVGMELSAALLGVGYILGPRIGGIMVGGGLLSSLVIIPAIAYWGDAREAPFYPETVRLIKDMGPGDIWTRYVRYIGAGAVAAAGIITLIRSIPTMVSSFRVGASQLREKDDRGTNLPRTSRDLPGKVVLIGASIIFVVLAAVPAAFGAIESSAFRVVAAFLVVLFAFFFVTVASRIVGMVGVTSNPTSGMTIAALLGSSAIFLLMGFTDSLGKAGALCVGCVVAIAASISGDTSQDLKTGYLLGATPFRQQIGELVGVMTSAVFVCLTVLWLDGAYGLGGQELPAPQANLMKLVIEGVLDQALPWALVGIGVGITIVIELLRLPSLPFAVGVYLPVATMVPLFIGGLLRRFIEKRAPSKEEAGQRQERGVLFGSGLVGGEGLLGVLIAGIAYVNQEKPAGIGYEWAGAFGPVLGFAFFACVGLFLFRCSVRRTDD